MNAAPIGIFDSGIGGLTVARALYDRLPHESTVYFGDTARVPYGPKSPETVRRYSLEILDWMLGQQVKPVIGVIDPGARAAASASTAGPIGVIGTAGTIASNAYARAIQRRRPDARVEQQACPLFVPLVEEGWFEHPAAALIAKEYLAPLRQAQVDTLVLGCTHYPLLKPLLQRVMGPDVRLIDSGEETAAVVGHVLERNQLAAPEGGRATHRFAVSDDEARFRHVGARFIGERLGRAEVVPLD
jgi:glutamate racemase